MALNVDKNRQLNEQQYQQTPPQPVAETKPAASQPIDMTAAGSQKEVPKTAASQPIDMTGGGTRTQEQTTVQPQPQEEKSYTVKKGDTLWAVAKKLLIESGNKKPSSADIMQAMQLIAQANGCSSVDECVNKFFNKIGSELNLTGLFVSQESQVITAQQPEQQVILTDEEKQLANKLKEKYPDLELDKMSDAEMKKMLDNFRENKPDVIAGLQKEISAAQTDAPQQDSSTQVDAEQLIKEKLGDVEITADNINSDDIKAKLEEFMKNASPDEIKAIAEYLHKSGVVSDIIPLPQQTDEIQSSVREYISANPDAKKPVGGTVDKSELETLAEQTGISGDFDEIIAEIKAKAKVDPKSLSKTEAELLKKYDAQITSTQDVSSPEDIEEEKQMLAMIKQMRANGMADLSPEEQTSMIMDAFLTKNDKVYQGLKTEEEKKEYLNKAIKDLQQISASNEDTEGLFAMFKDNLSMIRSVVLLQYAEKNGKSIEDLKQMKPEERAAIINKGENKAIELGFKLIKGQAGDKLANASEEEKVNIYADALLNLLDKEYAKMPDGPQKEQYREKAIADFAAKLFKGKNVDIAAKLKDPKFKEELFLQISYALDYISDTKAEGDFVSKIREFNIKTPEARNGMIIKMLETKETQGKLTKNDEKRLIAARNYEAVLKRFRQTPGNDGKVPNTNQALEIVEAMIAEAKRSGASPEEIQDLMGLQAQLKYKQEAGGGNDMFRPRLSLTDEAAIKNKELFKVYEEQFENFKPHTEEFDNEIRNTIKDRIGEINDVRVLCDFLKKQGYSDEQIALMIRDTVPADVLTHIMTKPPSSEDYAYMQNLMNGVKNDAVYARMEKLAAMQGRNAYGYTMPEQINVGASIANDTRLHNTYQASLVANNDRETVSTIISGINNSGKVSDSNISQFNKTFISETLTNDSDRLYYGKSLSQNTNNSAALEGLAAASGSIQDQGIRSQYNSHVETAASNLPPTEQAKVKTAMQTGQISQETLSKTSTSSSSSKSQAQQTSQNSNTQTTTNPTSQRQGSAQAQGTAQNTQAAQAQQNQARAAAQQAVAQQAAQLRQQAATNPMTFGSSSTVSGSSSVSTSSTTSTSSTSSTSSSDDADSVVGYTKAEAQAIAQADEEKRLELMQKVQELKTDIDNSIEEWEARHRKLTTEEGDVITAGAAIDAAIEAINSSAYTPSEKEELKSRIIKATSIDEIYEILVSKSVDIVHVKDKILDLLSTSGSGTSVRNVVAEVIGDDTVVKELFLSTSSTSVKKELLNLMSPDTVVELLASKQISNIADVDHKILRTFLEKNIYSMSNTEFNEYLKHLPLDDRMALVEMRNNARGITAKMNVPAGEAHSADMPSPVSQDEELPPASGQNSPLGKGEMSRTLADGSVITRQGSGFGAVSDTDFDTYQVLSPDEVKRQQGAPIGMDDEVLTVGSAEWNMKYNRNNVQTTAFTLNAMDENDEDDGIGNIMSTKGNFKGTRIKKKYKPGGFNAMG